LSPSLPSTYIDSNEEFIYSTKDLLPGPLKLECVKKFGDSKATFERTAANEIKEGSFRINKLKQIWTERDAKCTDKFNQTNYLGSDSNSKISSYINVNPLLSDEKSTFRNVTNRSHNLTKIKDQS
jgi:hypothetical protein